MLASTEQVRFITSAQTVLPGTIPWPKQGRWLWFIIALFFFNTQATQAPRKMVNVWPLPPLLLLLGDLLGARQSPAAFQ